MSRQPLRGWLLLCLLSVACRDPTEVTLVITTDVACARLKETTVTPGTLGPIEGLPFATSTEQCTDGAKENAIGSIVLFPSGDKNGSFGVRIVAGVDVPAEECAPPLYKGCIVARRAMIYAPHTPLVLPVVLRESCKDVVCDPSSTCVQGSCVSATVPDPSACAGAGCSETVLRQSTGSSGGQPGALDSGAGATDSGASSAGGSGGASGAGGTLGSGGASSGGGTAVVDSGAGLPEAALPPAPDAAVSRDASTPPPPVDASSPVSTKDAAIRDAAPRVADARVPDAAPPLVCTAPFADCNGLASDGCETDTSADALNCGRCKASCFGAACSAGVCAPVTVATGLASPWNVAADEANVYWTDHTTNSVMQQPLAGGTAITIASGLTAPTGIAVDSTHVYWTAFGANGAIQRAPIGGGGPVQTLAPANAAYTLTLDGSYVYWANCTSNSTVERVPKDGSAAETIVAAGQPFPLMVVLDATSFYWDNWANNADVDMRPKDLSAPLSVVATASKAPYALARFGTDVYYTTDVGGDVFRIPQGGAATLLVTGEKKPLSMIVDASGIYWANNGNGTIRALPPGATVAITLASNQSGTRSIATNSNSLFWQTSSAVMRLGK